MTVGELIGELQALIAGGACTTETQVLADGCDCWGEAKAAVVVDQGEDGRRGQPHLLVSREVHESKAEGTRVSDLPQPRTFTTTEAKGS